MDYGINLYPYFNQDSLYNAYLYQYANPNFANISPVQYGYQNVQNPSFKGSLTTQPDTVSFSASNEIQPQKKGMSKGARVGLGAVTVAGLGTLVYLLSKGKIGAKQAKELAEHVEFKPAKTVEEAKKFAQEKLGVTYLDDMGKFEDTEMVNFVNDWLVKCHNNPKIGYKLTPKYVYAVKDRDAAMSMSGKLVKDGKNYGHALGINLDYFNNFEERVLKDVREKNSLPSFLKLGEDGKYVITNPNQDNEYTRRLAKYMNSKNLTFLDKMQCHLDLVAYYNDAKIINNTLVIKPRKVDNYLNHELGHLLHEESCSNYDMMKKIEEFKAVGKPVSDITQEFVSDKKIQETARKVSDYATESPLEFVAETFANMQDGRTFSDDVMALYKKYGGPELK